MSSLRTILFVFTQQNTDYLGQQYRTCTTDTKLEKKSLMAPSRCHHLNLKSNYICQVYMTIIPGNTNSATRVLNHPNQGKKFIL